MEQVVNNNKTDAIIAALNANRSVKKGARLSSTRKYTVHMDGDLTAVLPPQALAVLTILLTNEDNEWTEVALHTLLSEHTEISDKQKPWAIFTYYRKKLVDSGFLTDSK